MVLPLNFFRKMDASGRYVIPAALRKEFGVNSSEDHQLCLIKDRDTGGYYLGFKVNPSREYLEGVKKLSSILG
jgi:bifunctional DNA-binding transcriptional regulator/antitoxin component of YhaV-PrlF toxin-antitoxin module